MRLPIDYHVNAAGGSYAQLYDTAGQQRLGTQRPEAFSDIISGDNITFVRSYVIVLDAAG